MRDDLWAIVGALAVLVVPLLMAWWLIGLGGRSSKRPAPPRSREKIDR